MFIKKQSIFLLIISLNSIIRSELDEFLFSPFKEKLIGSHITDSSFWFKLFLYRVNRSKVEIEISSFLDFI